MAVQVLIRRKIMETKTKEVAPLIVKLRSLATIQPGYICGETLNCIDPPGHSEYLVRSTWHSVKDWEKWLRSKERIAINAQIDQLSREKSEYAIYEPLVGGIIPASTIQGEKMKKAIQLNNISFADIAIVSCGTLSLELNYLKKEGFLDTSHLFFTTPGLHEDIQELEAQLIQRIKKAKEKVDKVLIVYGGKFCYVNADEPTRTMQKIIEGQGPGVARIQATHCMDMIAGQAERELIAKEIAGNEKVWWMTPGWIQFRHKVFKGWDKGLANENFPRHTGGAIVLDGIGYVDQYMTEQPEEFLEYSDWMGIPIQGYPVTLDRLKSLLLEQARILNEKKICSK